MKKRGIVKRALHLSIHFSILLVWVITMFLLVKKEGLLKEKGVSARLRDIIPENIDADIWKGIYISGQWAGYVHTTMGPYLINEEDGLKGYTITSVSYLRFKMFDQLKDIEFRSVQMLDSTFRLVKFEASISGMTRVMVKGKRAGDYILVEVMVNTEKYKRVLESPDDIFLENSILSIYRGKGLKVGDSYTLNIFNPLTFSAEPIKVESTGKEGDLLILETRFGGIASKAWVDKEGYVVREETSNGWVMRRESMGEIQKEMAENAQKGVDILTNVAVLTEKNIDQPRLVGMMRIKIAGIDLKEFPFDGKRQRLINGKEGLVEIRSIFPEEGDAVSLPYRGEEIKKYLEPSLWIQSRDPKIKKKASEIVGEEQNSWRAAQKIERWVNENVKKVLKVGVPVATTVLLYREGDCNEHTALFVALARACGLPADMCAGLVYIEDGFYYHAWPKVYVGEWIHCDPTFGQPVADATHLELVCGDFTKLSKLAMTIGKIKIAIEEAEVWRDSFDRD